MTLPRLSVFNSLRARLVAGLLMVGLIGAGGMGALTEIQRRSPNDVLETPPWPSRPGASSAA